MKDNARISQDRILSDMADMRRGLKVFLIPHEDAQIEYTPPDAALFVAISRMGVVGSAGKHFLCLHSISWLMPAKSTF